LVEPGLVADHFENDNENVTEQLAEPDDKRREHDLTLLPFHTVINNAANNVDDEDSLSEEENNVFRQMQLESHRHLRITTFETIEMHIRWLQ
jgi:hypothetical protein